MSKPKGTKDKNPGTRTRPDLKGNRFHSKPPGTGRTMLLQARVSQDVLNMLIAFGPHESWGTRLENAMRVLEKTLKDSALK